MKHKNKMLTLREFAKSEGLIPPFFAGFYFFTVLDWRIGLLFILGYNLYMLRKNGMKSADRLARSIIYQTINFGLILWSPLIGFIWSALLVFVSARDVLDVWRIRKNYRKYRKEMKRTSLETRVTTPPKS